MSDEATKTNELPFRPCPVCSGAGYQNDYLVSVGYIACEDCGLEMPVGVWDQCSDDAALRRTIERLERFPGYELIIQRGGGSDGSQYYLVRSARYRQVFGDTFLQALHKFATEHCREVRDADIH